ncbi:hypothetical protein VNO77_09674 [Canavalia gladiata]|uniref:Uncharacterized protein n=1 Tax=Canavalia gladiata TaxID=3824 RepID=A0AAN9QXG7_CANGL
MITDSQSQNTINSNCIIPELKTNFQLLLKEDNVFYSTIFFLWAQIISLTSNCTRPSRILSDSDETTLITGFEFQSITQGAGRFRYLNLSRSSHEPTHGTELVLLVAGNETEFPETEN